MSWTIINNHIAIQENGTAHLNAVDIYTALKSGGISVFQHTYPSPETAFPDIYFSSIAREADVSLLQKEDDIYLLIAVDGVPVDFAMGTVLDQLVIENEWFYISNAEEINSLLAGTQITDNGKISMSQYIELLKRDGNRTGL